MEPKDLGLQLRRIYLKLTFRRADVTLGGNVHFGKISQRSKGRLHGRPPVVL